MGEEDLHQIAAALGSALGSASEQARLASSEFSKLADAVCAVGGAIAVLRQQEIEREVARFAAELDDLLEFGD